VVHGNESLERQMMLIASVRLVVTDGAVTVIQPKSINRRCPESHRIRRRKRKQQRLSSTSSSSSSYRRISIYWETTTDSVRMCASIHSFVVRFCLYQFIHLLCVYVIIPFLFVVVCVWGGGGVIFLHNEQ